MAVINPPGYLHNLATHTAQVDRIGAIAGGLVPNGPGLTWRAGVRGVADLKVSALATPNMTVDVAAGLAFVAGSESTFQGVYAVPNDGVINLTIGPSNATLNRRDLIVAKVEDSFYSGTNDVASIVVVPGVEASSPVDPTQPPNSLLLGRVRVDAGVTSISASAIDDLRQWTSSLGGVVPVLSTAQRDAMSPQEGLVIYRMDTDAIEGYNGSKWLGGKQFVRKSVDETRPGTTAWSDDGHLKFDVVAGVTYKFKMVLHFSNNGTSGNGDATIRFTHPSGTLDYAAIGPEVAIGSTTHAQGQWGSKLGSTTSPTASTRFGCTTSNVANPVFVRGTFVATATGTVKLQWTQDTASFTTTLHTGSYVEAEAVA